MKVIKVNYNQYINISSSFTINSIAAWDIGKYISLIVFDLRGDIPAGESLLGAGANNLKGITYGSARITIGNTTYSATICLIATQFRIHTSYFNSSLNANATAGSIFHFKM